MNIIRVDEEGVPCLVQRMSINTEHLANVEYFDGTKGVGYAHFPKPTDPRTLYAWRTDAHPSRRDWIHLDEYFMRLGWWWALVEQDAIKTWHAGREAA